jgi:hypothetical protein
MAVIYEFPKIRPGPKPGTRPEPREKSLNVLERSQLTLFAGYLDTVLKTGCYDPGLLHAGLEYLHLVCSIADEDASRVYNGLTKEADNL